MTALRNETSFSLKCLIAAWHSRMSTCSFRVLSNSESNVFLTLQQTRDTMPVLFRASVSNAGPVSGNKSQPSNATANLSVAVNASLQTLSQNGRVVYPSQPSRMAGGTSVESSRCRHQLSQPFINVTLTVGWECSSQ